MGPFKKTPGGTKIHIRPKRAGHRIQVGETDLVKVPATTEVLYSKVAGSEKVRAGRGLSKQKRMRRRSQKKKGPGTEGGMQIPYSLKSIWGPRPRPTPSPGLHCTDTPEQPLSGQHRAYTGYCAEDRRDLRRQKLRVLNKGTRPHKKNRDVEQRVSVAVPQGNQGMSPHRNAGCAQTRVDRGWGRAGGATMNYWGKADMKGGEKSKRGANYPASRKKTEKRINSRTALFTPNNRREVPARSNEPDQ